MKVMNEMKNISIQEFQHCLESRLIEVMNLKMLPIQFNSKVARTQLETLYPRDEMDVIADLDI
jgi:hypothetical protein